jgi:hypothetical protein
MARPKLYLSNTLVSRSTPNALRESYNGFAWGIICTQTLLVTRLHVALILGRDDKPRLWNGVLQLVDTFFCNSFATRK